MGIMTRIIKIFKADIHGVMDQLEDQELLLKQHLRDMQDALNQKEIDLNNLLVAQKQAQAECSRYRRQAEVLEADLEVSIRKNKHDMARKLIRKVVPINKLVDELSEHIKALEDDIANAGLDLDRQRLQYEQIKQKAAELFRRTQLGVDSAKPTHTDPDCISDLSEEEVELELLKRKDALSAA